MNASASTDVILARAAVVLLLGNVISRILGLVREQTIAYLFGVSGAASSFCGGVPSADNGLRPLARWRGDGRVGPRFR